MILLEMWYTGHGESERLEHALTAATKVVSRVSEE